MSPPVTFSSVTPSMLVARLQAECGFSEEGSKAG